MTRIDRIYADGEMPDDFMPERPVLGEPFELPKCRMPNEPLVKPYWNPSGNDPLFLSKIMADAVWFLDSANEEDTNGKKGVASRLRRAAVLSAFAAIEYAINVQCYAFMHADPNQLGLHERDICEEKTTRMRDGQFYRERMNYSLESRYLFVYVALNRKPFDKGCSEWSSFVEAKNLRDRLTHPKVPANGMIEKQDVQDAIESVIKMIGMLHGDSSLIKIDSVRQSLCMYNDVD